MVLGYVDMKQVLDEAPQVLAGREEAGVRVLGARDLLGAAVDRADHAIEVPLHAVLVLEERGDLVRAALAMAREAPPALDRGNASDWLRRELAPIREGMATVGK